MRTDLDPYELGTRPFYKILTSVVVPRPIARVSTRSADGVDNLAPHSFFTVSCVDPDQRHRDGLAGRGERVRHRRADGRALPAGQARAVRRVTGRARVQAARPFDHAHPARRVARPLLAADRLAQPQPIAPRRLTRDAVQRARPPLPRARRRAAGRTATEPVGPVRLQQPPPHLGHACHHVRDGQTLPLRRLIHERATHPIRRCWPSGRRLRATIRRPGDGARRRYLWCLAAHLTYTASGRH
jgi:hypothetical protein